MENIARIRLALVYEVEGEHPELEQLAAEIIRVEADGFAEAVKRKLSAAGAEVTSFRADYE